MQRRESRTRESGNAAVGQASRQRVHVPQRSASNGASGASAASVRMTPMNVKEPSLGWMSIVLDRKSTRLNSSHSQISYAVFCLKKKKNTTVRLTTTRTGD